MNKVFKCNSKAGSKKSNNPRRLNNNTDLCVDVKFRLRHDRIAMIGKNYPGVLKRDEECHYTFTEAVNADKRNPQVFYGNYITITRRDDGSLRLNFRPVTMGADFNIYRYATGVFSELIRALIGLVGKEARK